jgi:hypothetical protein
MNMAGQDFQNFELADLAAGRETAYTLADGVITEVAERLDVALADEPNSEGLGELVGKLGKNKVLRDNEEVTAIDRETAIDLVDRSGVQKQLHRSLWTPDSPADDLNYVVMTGAVANWQDRAVLHVQDVVPRETGAIVATGIRVMDTATEQANPHVIDFVEEEGHYPTESEYAPRYVAPGLRATQQLVISEAYETRAGDEIADSLFEDHPFLLSQRVGFVRVANAGIQLAVQMRSAARRLDPRFDADPEHPQVFVLTDTFELARTEAEEAQPHAYQKALTALRQVAVTAKMLHEAAGGE